MGVRGAVGVSLRVEEQAVICCLEAIDPVGDQAAAAVKGDDITRLHFFGCQGWTATTLPTFSAGAMLPLLTIQRR